MGLVLLLWACDGSDSSAKSKKDPWFEVEWDEVTHDVNGGPIERVYLFYIVYVQSETYETTHLFQRFRVDKGCHMVYVTATRMDTDPWLESEPSEVVSVCRE